MKTKGENKAVGMSGDDQGRNADSNIAHTLKQGEQEFSFPHEGITVVASNAAEAEKKKDEILRSQGRKIENKEKPVEDEN